MTPDELKSMSKGSFVVMKTGVHPMRVRLRLFLDWGIRFREPYQVPERSRRMVSYASKRELEREIVRCHHAQRAVCDAPLAPLPMAYRPPPTRGGGISAQNRRFQRVLFEQRSLRVEAEDLEDR